MNIIFIQLIEHLCKLNFLQKIIYLESHQKLSQVIVEFGAFLQVSIELHESIIGLKISFANTRSRNMII